VNHPYSLEKKNSTMQKAYQNTPFVHLYPKFWSSQCKAVCASLETWTPSKISCCCWYLEMIILELPGRKAGEMFRLVERGSLEPRNLHGPRLCSVSSTLQQLYSLRQAVLSSFSFTLLWTSNNSMRIYNTLYQTYNKGLYGYLIGVKLRIRVWKQVGSWIFYTTKILDTH
jgi:hypothetical protein